MQVLIENDKITVQDPTPELLSVIHKNLSYKDKSKQYQLKRMSRSPWARTSPLYKKLQSEVNGQLFTYENNRLIFPSTFSHLCPVDSNTIDSRKETGVTLPLPWMKKPFDLRDYQEEAVQLMLIKPRGLINFATGLGKTLVATHLVKRYRRKALIVCPSESVAKQFYKEFVEAFGKNKVGMYGAGKKQISEITVGIAASISRNISEFQRSGLGLVIFDETHHTPATTFYQIADALCTVGKIFGLTATDFRSDGKDVMITAGCGPVLLRRDIKWGVENKWLAEPHFLVREVPTTGKDFKDDKLRSYKEHILNSPVMLDRIENDARSMMAAGKSLLILVDMVEHGEKLSKALGIPFATGEDKNSQEYVGQLNKGTIPGLIGTDGKISEGTDTRNVDCLILANFAGSKGPVIQAIGRGLRKQGAKTKCLILDYIPLGSTMLSRHGYNRVDMYRDITDKVRVIEHADK